MALDRQALSHGIMWVCPSCHGRASGIGFVRRALDPGFEKALWLSAVEAGPQSDRNCPVCTNAMRQTASGATVLDVCKSCRFVWFDPDEFDLAPKQKLDDPRVEIPQENLEAMARLQSETIARRWSHLPDGELGSHLALVPAALGWPMEEDLAPMQLIPWVTWALAIAATVVGIVAGGGSFQLATNLYFLMVFGDDVEDFLGHGNFVLLYLVAAFAGGALHALVSSPRGLIVAGTSAAISGIVVFYGLRFPQARLRYFKLFRWYTLPASAATAAWFLSQFVGTRGEWWGVDAVPLWAHVGGSAIGFWFWFLWRRD